MDLLDYIRQHDEAGASPHDEAEVEYRFLCSGVLYRANVAGDWTRSDICRLVLDKPFRVFVASSRIDENPQELSVRFRAGPGRLASGRQLISGWPDREIAQDLATVLTALTRRPVSVIGKTRSLYLGEVYSVYPQDWPNPILNLPTRHWAPRGITVMQGIDSVQIKDNDPPPVPVDPDAVSGQLRALALTDAQYVLRAARLYATALELIIERPQVAYLLLVSTIETLAAEYLKEWEPTEAEQALSFGAVTKQARKFGLSIEQVRLLTLAAAKGQYWIKRKFVKFIVDRVGDDLWVDDDLFPIAGLWKPDRAKLEKYLGTIYDTRSLIVHEGHRLPLAMTVGTSHLIDAMAAYERLESSSEILPPLVWFEKAVSICLRSRIDEIRSALDGAQPTSELKE